MGMSAAGAAVAASVLVTSLAGRDPDSDAHVQIFARRVP